MNIKPPVPPKIYVPVLAMLSGLLIWTGSRNRPDPVWQKADTVVNGPCLMIENVVDSISFLYAKAHKRPIPKGRIDSTGFKILEKPRLRTLGWNRFRNFFNATMEEKKMVVSGVTGTGSTKMAIKMANFLASHPENNYLQVDCAPQFDLELHKKYIGHEKEDGQFEYGLLLQFWDRCRQNPSQNFVCVIDNFDKINPETFFGPALWEKLGSPKDAAKIGGKNIEIPSNCWMFSVTHRGPGSRIEFNEEHIKRLGKPYIVHPEPCEMIDYFRKGAEEVAKDGGKSAEQKKVEQTALLSKINQHRVMYYFLKANQMMTERYGEGFELGQGSNVRKYYMPNDLPLLKETYINHINSIRGVKSLNIKSFNNLDYTLANDGIEPHTNFFERQVQWLRDTGYLVEVTMVAATALLTTFIGWWLLRRRERMIRGYGTQAQQIFDDFEAQKIDANEAMRQLELIKSEVNDLVLQRKLNYTEGLYFMGFIDDKARRIDFTRNVSANFLELFNAFMEDDILTENEYQKLCQFLESIRSKIPVESYHEFLDKVEWAHKNKPAQ